jgi:hypothetical protein
MGVTMKKLPGFLRFIIRWLIILVVIFLIGAGLIAYFVKDKAPPDAGEAPWLIKTSSRIYYAKELSMLPDGNPQIKGYWELNDGRYYFTNEILPFPKKSFGNVDIVRRPKE